MTATPDSPLDSILIRPYRGEDADFFFRSFLDSYGRGSPTTAHIQKSVFYPAHRAVIARLVERPDAQVMVACLEEDESTLIGFVLAETGPKPVLHYVYVKAAFRRFGVGRLLVDAVGLSPEALTFSHWTYPTGALLAKWPRAKYNPYLLEETSWKTPRS